MTTDVWTISRYGMQDVIRIRREFYGLMVHSITE